MKDDRYVIVTWPDTQKLMNHPRFNECLLIDNIEGHIDVGSSAYAVPIDIYNEIYNDGYDFEDLAADAELLRQSAL